MNPLDPHGWFVSGALAIAAIIDENYPEAINWADKALLQNRRFAVALARARRGALVKPARTNAPRRWSRNCITPSSRS